MFSKTAKKRRIALLMLDVGDLTGGGGAERFFSDFFELYNSQNDPKFELFFITDSIKNFNTIGKLNKFNDHILILSALEKWFSNSHCTINPLLRKIFRCIILIKSFSQLWFALIKNKIDLVHISLLTKFHYRFFRAIDVMPKFWRPKISINIVDFQIPYYYYSTKEEHIRTSAHRYHYEKLFNNIKISGIFSWYLKFKEFAETNNIIKSKPPIKVITSRFVINSGETKNIEKENKIVFAGRLIEVKKPLFFAEAVRILRDRNIKIMLGWKFYIYGKGNQESLINEFISKNLLSDILIITHHDKMSDIFTTSKCFISTQDYENFPSLSMAEAMIHKNAVIARNVGQTNYFVKNSVNGYTLQEDTPAGLAKMIELYLENSHLHKSFGEESYKLMTTIHTPENFIKQIDSYWSEIIGLDD